MAPSKADLLEAIDNFAKGILEEIGNKHKDAIEQYKIKFKDQLYPQCQAAKRDKNRCRKAAAQGGRFCGTHKAKREKPQPSESGKSFVCT